MAILAKADAYPVRAVIRVPSGMMMLPDGTIQALPERRASYQGDFDKGSVHATPPQKGSLPSRPMKTGEFTMTLLGPDHYPAGAGPDVLPPGHPSGVALIVQEVAAEPNGTNDACDLHLCVAEDCGKPATAYADYCREHDPAPDAMPCANTRLTDAGPRPCLNAPVPGSPFCLDCEEEIAAEAEAKKARRRIRRRPGQPARPRGCPRKVALNTTAAPPDVAEAADGKQNLGHSEG